MSLDLGILANKVVQFIRQRNIGHMKTNERQWGSYDIVLINPRGQALVTNITYGWGFTTEQAAAVTLVKLVIEASKLDDQLVAWLGQELVSELTSLTAEGLEAALVISSGSM